MRAARDPVVLALTACEKTSGSWGGDSAAWPSAQKTRAQSRAIEHERPRSKPLLFSRAVRRREPPISAKQRHSRPWQIVSAHDDAGSSKQPQLPLRRLRGHNDARSAGLARPPRARRAHRALTRRERRAAARARMSICDLRLCAVRSRAVAAVVWVVGGRGAEHGGLGRQSTARRRGVHVHFTMKTPKRCT